MSWDERAIFTADGRVVVPFRESHLMDLVVTEAPHVVLLDKARNYYDTSRPPTWRPLTAEGFAARPLPWNWVERFDTPDGARFLARGLNALALCGPDLDSARADRRFEHVQNVTRLGATAVWVRCAYQDELGETKSAETITNNLLEPLSPPGSVLTAYERQTDAMRRNW